MITGRQTRPLFPCFPSTRSSLELASRWQEESEELKQVTKSSEMQERSLTQAQIDPLRQGQRLDAIDQEPKYDSSKTEVMLDAVMQEAEGRRGKIRSQNKTDTPHAKPFPLTSATLPK